MMSVRKLWLAVAVVCIGIAGWWLLRPERNYTNFPPTATGPWVAFGDSLTAGFGATEGNDYPTVLGQKLGVEIRNAGRSGETTADGLKRVEEVAAIEPRVVLVCFGGNDSLNQQSRAETFANVGRMIERLHQAGSFVVLIGIRSASLRDFNEEHFAKLAREKRVLYVPDMLRGVVFKPVYMSDAIHPNDAGYQKIAERLEKKLRPLLPELKLASAVGPTDALHGVAHNDKQARPLRLIDLVHSTHDAVVDFCLVRLAQANNENAVVRFITMLREAFIRGDEEAALVFQPRPEDIIVHPLINGTANIENIVTKTAEFLNRPGWDVLIHENSHS